MTRTALPALRSVFDDNSLYVELPKSPFTIACDVAFDGKDQSVVMVFKKEGENIIVLDSEVVRPTKNFMEARREVDMVIDKFKKLYASNANIVESNHK